MFGVRYWCPTTPVGVIVGAGVVYWLGNEGGVLKLF